MVRLLSPLDARDGPEVAQVSVPQHSPCPLESIMQTAHRIGFLAGL